MFWILEIFPYWLWWLILLAGSFAYLLVPMIPIKTYKLPIKIISTMVVCSIIFIMGLFYADGVWQQAARDLEAKVVAAESQAKVVNEVIKEKVVTKTQIVKQRGQTVIKYIDREVVKLDETCKVPVEFVNIHNQAASK